MKLRLNIIITLAIAATSAAPAPLIAQERPYFVTYDHYLEEPGNLEVAVENTSGFPRDGGARHAPWLELEYGFTGWWTAELYLEGVTTRRDGSAFTGWRWENRFRPLQGEHAVNPVLYVEYESINEGSRIQKEIVGAGPLPSGPIAALREEHARELEGKLILSSVAGSWNVAENIVFEKNLSADEGVEFGYSVGVSRPLGALASGTACRLCAENFVVGLEAYGGLGSTDAFAAAQQRHYLAPVVAWHLGDRTTLKASVGFGLTENADRTLLRFGLAYEFPIGGRK